MTIAWLLVAACSLQPPGEPPRVINANAHGGGSAVAFSPDGAVLASAGWAGRLRLWDSTSGVHVRYWPAHDESVNGIVFLSNIELVSAGYDGWIRRWSIDGLLLHAVDTGAPVTQMVAAPVAGRMLTGHADGSLRTWRLPDFALLETRELHRGAVRAVALASTRPVRYASSGRDGAVYHWQAGTDATRLPDPPTDAWSLAFAPDAATLSGGGWFRLFRWGLADASLRTLPTPHRGIIRAIDYLPRDGGLASISRQTDSAVEILDPDTGRSLRRFRRHELCGADIAVSADGRFLATTSDDASVRIWDLRD